MSRHYHAALGHRHHGFHHPEPHSVLNESLSQAAARIAVASLHARPSSGIVQASILQILSVTPKPVG